MHPGSARARRAVSYPVALSLCVSAWLAACSNKAEAPTSEAVPPVAAEPASGLADARVAEAQRRPAGGGGPNSGAPARIPTLMPPPIRATQPTASEAAEERERVEPCALTQSELSVADCQAAQRALDAARPGSAAIDAPSRMRQGQTTEVTLVLQASNSAAAQQAVLDAASAAAGSARERATDHFAPLVGARMQVELTGDGFDFKPQSNAVQLVRPDATTSWHWLLTAKSPGKHKLIFTTTVSFQDRQGQELQLRQTPDYREIEVAVGFESVSEWLQDTKVLIGLLTAVLTALAGLFAAWRKLKGGKAGKANGP